MFLSMSLCFFTTQSFRTFTCAPTHSTGPVRGWHLFRRVSLPAICDLTGTGLCNIALLFLAPSIWQMLRGSELVFTAMWSIIYRHKKLEIADWIGVLTTVVGIVTVGLSSLLTEPKTALSTQSSLVMQIIAIILVLMGMNILGFDNCLEEELLQDIDATPSEMVAYEGLWGFYFTTFVVLPLVHILPENAGEGVYEHTLESLKMLGSSVGLFGLWLGFIAVSLGYNWGALAVCSFTNGINRAIFEALRAIGVWILSVVVGYLWKDSGGGERLTKASGIQGIGFGLMVIGSFIFNRVVKLPRFCEKCSNSLSQEGLTVEPESLYTQAEMASKGNHEN